MDEIPNHDALLGEPNEDVDGPEGEFEACVFCESTRHESGACPHADESVDESLWED